MTITISPQLSYIILTDAPADALMATIDEIMIPNPAVKMAYQTLDKKSPELTNWQAGVVSEFLNENYPELFPKALAAKTALHISATIDTADSLKLVEEINQGVSIVGLSEDDQLIFDELTNTLHTAKDWYALQENCVVTQNPSQNIDFRCIPYESEDYKDECWMITRGMLKYGLPEFSLHRLPTDDQMQIAHALLSYLANDLIYKQQSVNQTLEQESTFTIPMEDGNNLTLQALFTGTPDDLDFRNYHLELSLLEN